MPISKTKRTGVRRPGVPLTELNRNIGEPPQPKPRWVPAEQAPVIDMLAQILTELKILNERLSKR